MAVSGPLTDLRRTGWHVAVVLKVDVLWLGPCWQLSPCPVTLHSVKNVVKNIQAGKTVKPAQALYKDPTPANNLFVPSRRDVS
jgi:hypothetical protein